jgi:methionyl-tRNA synthetase
MNNTIFITTSIPYVNSRPHIGHAQEFVVADCIARLYRSLDYRVTFQTGTDENAFKNVVAALQAGVSPQEFVDKNAEVFKALVKQLNISVDTFIRTTEPRHRRGVEQFWWRLKPEDLYLKSYEGLYCIGCEDFFLENHLVNGVCPDHKIVPEGVNEQNIFFRLSRYQKVIEEFIATDKIKIVPETRKNETLSFVRQGLHDISLTRAKSRSGGWGIPAPGAPDQVVYVWIDALINYITGQGFGENDNWKHVWSEETKKIHVIGKNVWKFHAVYWPALLLSAGLPLPNEIVVHGFLTNNGIKISKSLGNTIDPLEVAKDFGPDPIRHLLLCCTPIFSDSDFSIERLNRFYHVDLANRLGNLYSRLAALCEKSRFQHRVLPCETTCKNVKNLLTDYSLQEISQFAWDQIDKLNAEINQQRPWELLKGDNQTKLHCLLEVWCRCLYETATCLEPFTPSTSACIQSGLAGQEPGDRILFPQRT